MMCIAGVAQLYRTVQSVGQFSRLRYLVPEMFNVVCYSTVEVPGIVCTSTVTCTTTKHEARSTNNAISHNGLRPLDLLGRQVHTPRKL
jgi:hypothetical protein